MKSNPASSLHVRCLFIVTALSLWSVASGCTNFPANGPAPLPMKSTPPQNSTR